MNPFEHYEDQLAAMAAELEAAEAATTLQQRAISGMTITRRYLHELKAAVTNSILTPEEEIHFFKQVKPRFYSELIFYYKLLQWELEKPTGGVQPLRKYWKQQLHKIYYFFRKYRFLHQYYRSGETYLDPQLFLRHLPRSLPGIAVYEIDTDPSFTTGYDFILARMLANERLQAYLEARVVDTYPADSRQEPAGGNLSWTGSKVALIELVYALQSTGVLNHGKTALSEIAQRIERIFGVELGNYYRVFQEIRIRKKSRTQFLDEMRERLIQKMDWADENPHIT